MSIPRPLRIVGMIAVAVVVVVVLGRVVVDLAGDDAIVGTLEASARGGCPPTDNCVSSYATDAPWAIDPIACAGSREEAVAAANDAIVALGDVDVARPGASYVVYSQLFRFPDDVRIEPSARGIEVLSSSRIGAGDMGVNRARVESIRETVAADPRC